MWRYLAGAVAALLLVTGGIFWGKSMSHADVAGALPVAGAAADGDMPLADPPAASEKTREEKRFSRYDKDKDGKVAREEYLASRRKAFAKLDTNGDGKLSFEEQAVKTLAKFAKADGDHDGALSATEFATTRVLRKAKPNCPPVGAGAAKEED